ncbi:alpha/beta hydrolase [Pelagibacterium luteolum]|uniref:Acetyl esterase/lipase n=1 Tax=Pelagibacterium luteolum TaxID=440168 RepID=A0A1G7WNA1_9HYPH|nr:alpha/beta hydrolase [Pelagibacterium luteolum]SDG73374.1 Acetyl esterase/lipase [Pelagibacterium luteolum]
MGVFAALFGAANAFSPVAVFGALVPKDGGVVVTRNIAYGPLPRHSLDVYRPSGDQVGRPVIYFSYGGGWESGEKSDYAFVGRAFAARGYVTVIADYRVVPDVVYPNFVADNALAVSWLRENVASFGGNRDNLFLMGHSAGAYNVVMMALDGEFGVANAPISGVVGLSGPYDFFPFDVPASQNAFGNFEQPEQTQPINHLQGDAPPMLLLHGDSDDTVRVRNSVALAQGLTEAGASAELKVYEGANHADTLSMPLRWRYPVFDDILTFLATHDSGNG